MLTVIFSVYVNYRCLCLLIFLELIFLGFGEKFEALPVML